MNTRAPRLAAASAAREQAFSKDDGFREHAAEHLTVGFAIGIEGRRQLDEKARAGRKDPLKYLAIRHGRYTGR